MVHNVIIIGGGPCGLATGLALQEQGIDYLILEKGAIVNSITQCPAHARFYSTSDRLEIGGIPFLTEETRPSRQELLRYYQSVVSRQSIHIQCHQMVVSILKKKDYFTLEVANHKGQKLWYQAKIIVLATGILDHPRRLGVQGEDMAKVMYSYPEGHYYYGQRVMVIGGKNSAMETAIDLYRNGAQVSLVHRGETIQGIKPALILDTRNLIEKKKIDFYSQSKVLSIEKDAVILETPTGITHIANDFVFPFLGYQPDVKLFESVGIQVDKTNLVPSFNPDTYETNIHNIFIAGVATGGTTNQVYIEDGRFHGDMIAKAIKHSLRSNFTFSD